MRMIRMIDVMQRDRGNAGVRDLMREALREEEIWNELNNQMNVFQ